MGKINFIWPLIKTKIGIASLALAAYIGAQNEHLVDRGELNLFHRTSYYAEGHHPGMLEVEDKINSDGDIEKKLINKDTNEEIYNIHKDYLPSNEVLFGGIENRIGVDTAEIYVGSKRLASICEKELYSDIDTKNDNIHPLDVSLDIMHGAQGYLSKLNYKGKSITLTESNLEQLFSNSSEVQDIIFEEKPVTSVSSEVPRVDMSKAEPIEMIDGEKSGSALPYILGGTVLAGCGLLYLRNRRKKMPRF